MALSQPLKKRFRTIGHELKPVVMVADNGATEGVLNEIDRALEDHELIKIQIRVLDRADKQTIIDYVCDHTGAELVQSVGKVALIYRAAKEPKERLSNILRYQHL